MHRKCTNPLNFIENYECCIVCSIRWLLLFYFPNLNKISSIINMHILIIISLGKNLKLWIKEKQTVLSTCRWFFYYLHPFLVMRTDCTLYKQLYIYTVHVWSMCLQYSMIYVSVQVISSCYYKLETILIYGKAVLGDELIFKIFNVAVMIMILWITNSLF